MTLFKVEKDETLTLISEKSFKLEKKLQELCEKNLETCLLYTSDAADE